MLCLTCKKELSFEHTPIGLCKECLAAAHKKPLNKISEETAQQLMRSIVDDGKVIGLDRE